MFAFGWLSFSPPSSDPSLLFSDGCYKCNDGEMRVKIWMSMSDRHPGIRRIVSGEWHGRWRMQANRVFCCPDVENEKERKEIRSRKRFLISRRREREETWVQRAILWHRFDKTAMKRQKLLLGAINIPIIVNMIQFLLFLLFSGISSEDMGDREKNIPSHYESVIWLIPAIHESVIHPLIKRLSSLIPAFSSPTS